MADSRAANVFRSPLTLALIALLMLLTLGFAANFYQFKLASSQGYRDLEAASTLKAISQSVAKHASSAASGDLRAFDEMTADKERSSRALSQFGASPNVLPADVNKVTNLWNDLLLKIDVVLAGQKALVTLRESASDIDVNVQLIQQENDKVVRALVRAESAANELVAAQRQSLLVERINYTLDKISALDEQELLIDQHAKDSASFLAVLEGFKAGDPDLQINRIQDEEAIDSLVRIEELFYSIATTSAELLLTSEEVAIARSAAAEIDAQSADFITAIESIEEKLMAGSGQRLIMVGAVIGGAVLTVFVLIGLSVHRQLKTSVNASSRQHEKNQEAILQLLDEVADLADGDLRIQATVTESFTGAIADSINFSIDQMRGLVSNINQTSFRVATAADETVKTVSQLSEASQRQANEIADVSEAVNEMAVSIDMVSSNAAESSSVAERSVDIANKGASVVQDTIGGMDSIRGQIQETAKRIKRLGESSQEIGDIVALINDIADQTNILSLNAAIQASMAGDAGKGFAVVADEVQRLAERSGAAAKQISALVKTIQSDTNEAVSSMEQTTVEVVQGTRLAQDAGVALGEIESVSTSLAEIIENISDAARQQAASAGKISNTMKSIQEITTAATDGTQETATAVGNLADMTNELRSSVSGFKLPD